VGGPIPGFATSGVADSLLDAHVPPGSRLRGAPPSGFRNRWGPRGVHSLVEPIQDLRVDVDIELSSEVLPGREQPFDVIDGEDLRIGSMPARSDVSQVIG
jgi:hypothetical protein